MPYPAVQTYAVHIWEYSLGEVHPWPFHMQVLSPPPHPLPPHSQVIPNSLSCNKKLRSNWDFKEYPIPVIQWEKDEHLQVCSLKISHTHREMVICYVALRPWRQRPHSTWKWLNEIFIHTCHQNCRNLISTTIYYTLLLTLLLLWERYMLYAIGCT